MYIRDAKCLVAVAPAKTTPPCVSSVLSADQRRECPIRALRALDGGELSGQSGHQLFQRQDALAGKEPARAGLG
jgi:hypothetical protein